MERGHNPKNERDNKVAEDLKRRLAELGIKKTRGPDRGFAPDFPTPGPVSPKKMYEELVKPQDETTDHK